MNEELRKLASWFKANKLSLNISKTKYSLFHSIRKRKDIPNILTPLHIGNVPIKRESSLTKFLGVYLNENISWKHHINIASIKVCKSSEILYRTRCILSKFLRKKFYFYFISCYLNYENITWVSTNKSKLQALYHHQKHTARIINFKDKFTSAKLLLEQTNAMINTLCFMYLCKNGNTLSIFKHIYTLKPINKYTTRSKNVLFKPLCMKNFAKCKLSYREPYLWNKIIVPNNELLEAVTIYIYSKYDQKRLSLHLLIYKKIFETISILIEIC